MIYLILSTIPAWIYLGMKAKNQLQMLQQNWYDNDHRYLYWIWKNKKKLFFQIELFFLLFILLIYVNFQTHALLIFAFYFYLLTKEKSKKRQNKLSLKFTKRIRRLVVTLFILYLLPYIFGLIFYPGINLYLFYFFFALSIYVLPFYVVVANIINIPIEKFVSYYYKRKAIHKLRSMQNLKVIGITGSYGKTSSKNILYDVLSTKYNVFKTPKNYNTPMGMMLSINNFLDKFNDYFIAEMGAFKKGEIKELCEMMHPTYGILTKIGTAHLESFGSQKNIQEGKFELIESLPKDGIGILNMDDPLQVEYKLKNSCKIVWIGIENEKADVLATNIKVSEHGMKFDCKFKGDKKSYAFETKLLGKANIYNILASIALGRELSIPMEQLIHGVKKVNAVEHRLELKRMGEITIIDDAYNSNPVGAKMALEVLDLMPGKKIIVTPGMIELGEKQYEYNKEFGKQIASVCDAVILVGKKQTKPIYDGSLEKKYNSNKIYILEDVKEAFPLIMKLKEKNTYALLENDLPDILLEEK